jgi:hypothetical protein
MEYPMTLAFRSFGSSLQSCRCGQCSVEEVIDRKLRENSHVFLDVCEIYITNTFTRLYYLCIRYYIESFEFPLLRAESIDIDSFTTSNVLK